MAENTETNGSKPPVEELAQMAIEDPKPAVSLRDSFKAFSKFGDTKSDGKQITLSQSDKWMKQAKVIDKKITTTDTGIHFKKFKAMKISFDDYNKFLDDLAKARKVDLEEIKKKLAECGAPGVSQVSAGKAAATVGRLTDTSKYTGSHKERFDDSGKGKGIAGRKNLVDESGYVSGYQHKDTIGWAVFDCLKRASCGAQYTYYYCGGPKLCIIAAMNTMETGTASQSRIRKTCEKCACC